MPKKVKHRKWHHLPRQTTGLATRGIALAFGSFGLKAMEGFAITSRQIESARRAMTRYIARGGKVWIRIFPDKPVTRKGAEVPMGKGKGAVDHYVAPVQAGRILFEIDGVSDSDANSALRLAAQKLPLKTRIVQREQR